MLTCPSCGEGNPDRAKFCLNCASPLAQVGAGTQAEERKTITVLFCDLVGFTAASDRADPEDVRARIRPYHARLKAEIESYGGTVEKFIGDAVMAIFGAPVSHEDDPERAVRAGLKVLESIEDLNEADPTRDLSVRVGVATGEALVVVGARPEHGEGMATGDVVNTASRLQGAAPVGGLVVNEATHHATERVIDYQALDSVAVKGKAEPLPIWQALSPRSRFGTDLTRTLSTPTVGRDLERNLLTSTFERCLRDASVHLVTVVGEPGVGKSRLVAELFGFIEAWPDLVTWRQGRCLPYGEGITFWALGEIVKAEAGILETDDPDTAGTRIDRVVPDDHPDAPWLRQRLRPLVGLEAPTAGKEENHAAWRAFLESVAERNPTVIVLEDLHWADGALLEFVAHVLEYASGVPLLLVATARPELYEQAADFASGVRNATRIDLRPLSEPDTARLIGNLLEQTVLPAEVQATILDRSGGNPLYAEEFVRLLQDTATLHRTGTTWALDPEAEIPLPSGVQGIIAARLDTLDPPHKALLYDASVIGKVFWSGGLAAMGGRDDDHIQIDLHHLARRELIRPARRSSMEGEHEYAFSHALVRDVCYAQIPRAARADRHVKAAAWIEQVASGRVEDHAEILVAHYTAALELSTASGRADTVDLTARAVQYLTLAGDRAMGMDGETGEAHYARALDLAGPDHPDRPGLLAKHGEALMQRARFPQARQAFEEAIAGYEARGDVKGMAVAMSKLGRVLSRLGDPMSRTLVVDSIGHLEPLGPSPELVTALGNAAGSAYLDGQLGVAIDLASRAVSLADELGLPDPVPALGARGGARTDLNDPRADDDLRRALSQATSQGLGRESAVIRFNLPRGPARLAGPRPLLEGMRELVDFAGRRGIEEFVLSAQVEIAHALASMGFWDEALSRSADLEVRLEATGVVDDLVGLRSGKVDILTRRGQAQDAEALAEWVVDRGREGRFPQEQAVAFAAASALFAAQGAQARALALLTELAAVPEIRADDNYVAALPFTVAIALRCHEGALAADLVEGVEPLFPIYEHALELATAILMESHGEHQQAADRFADAADRWKTFEMPWEEGQALLGRGRCLLALDRPEDASTPLRQARRIFARLGARPALAESDALLEKTIASAL